MLSESIKKLVQYGVESGITPECERIYATNLLLDAFGESEYTEPETEYAKINLEETLNELLDEAVKRGIIEDSIVYRDLFDTKLMNCLMPRPAQVQRYHDQPVQAGKRPKGYRSCQAGKIQQLSKMSALSGK